MLKREDIDIDSLPYCPKFIDKEVFIQGMMKLDCKTFQEFDNKMAQIQAQKEMLSNPYIKEMLVRA